MGCIAPGGGPLPVSTCPAWNPLGSAASLLEWLVSVRSLRSTPLLVSSHSQSKLGFCILKTLNKYRYLNFFVRSENHRMNWQRLYRSTGLTHFTDEATDRRRWRELLKVASGSAMTRARSHDSQALLFPRLSAGSPKTYSLMEF